MTGADVRRRVDGAEMSVPRVNVTSMESTDRADVVTAARTCFALAGDPAVAASWDADSACAGMTVGGLAHHLVGQIRHIANLLTEPPTAESPIPLLEHYARAAWVRAPADDDANTSIRDNDNAAASAGPAAVLGEIPSLLDQLPELLELPRSPDTVNISWQGWTLATDDFLVMRSMELVVHSDDLAASVGLTTPTFPDSTVARVVGLLAGIAVRRHGQSAIVRALSRPQRAPGSVSAF